MTGDGGTGSQPQDAALLLRVHKGAPDAEELAALVIALLGCAQPAAARSASSVRIADWRCAGQPIGFVVAHSWQAVEH